MDALSQVKAENAPDYERICATTTFRNAETEHWKKVVEKMYYPFSEEHGVFLQQHGFLDKELIPVAELPADHRPIVEHWSWDRSYIMQADIFQGFYFFENAFDLETLKRHCEFYEPLTVHESSLSPCIYSILAAKLGDHERAYAFYLRTARLDLDDYNNDSCDGLHITSMAGTWMSIVKGFAGMCVVDNQLTFNPFLPKTWTCFSFKIRFRGEVKKVVMDKDGLRVDEVVGHS
ncbi:MAG: maltose phosphorylase [Bacteroidia bacterium]|jgi:maltose phosphorylase